MLEIQSEKFDKFGTIFKEGILGVKLVHIADADANQVIIQSEGPFPVRGLLNVEAFKERLIWSFVGDDYERWKAARSPIAPTFLRPVEIQKFAPGINSVAKDAVKRLGRVSSYGRIAQLKVELVGYSTENICLLVFGERMGFFDDPQNPKMTEFIQSVRDFSAAEKALKLKSVPL